LDKLFDELNRRNVFCVAVAYLIASWLVIQVADIVLEAILVSSYDSPAGLETVAPPGSDLSTIWRPAQQAFSGLWRICVWRIDRERVH
jgi:hypothetical protein